MASSINASTSGAGGVITTADSSGILNLQSGGTTVATVSSTGFSTPANQTINTANTFGFKNRIINGGMTIDQRNASASVTISGAAVAYPVDRFFVGKDTSSGTFTVQQNQGSVTPPSTFINYLGVTTGTAFTAASGDGTYVQQRIEGTNIADLGWGTANAQTVTLSFWVRSSLTGTFSGSLANSAGNRSYPFSYTISSANTWTNIAVTIPGDTTGTWLTTTGIGIRVYWNLGSGSGFLGTGGAWASAFLLGTTGSVALSQTAGATFYLTGVQLEIGSQATSFDFRDYGRELEMCQRYYWRGTISAGGVWGGANNVPIVAWGYPVSMRTSPSWAWVSGGAASNGNADYTIIGTTGYGAYVESARLLYTTSGGGTNTSGCCLYNAVGYFTAEL